MPKKGVTPPHLRKFLFKKGHRSRKARAAGAAPVKRHRRSGGGHTAKRKRGGHRAKGMFGLGIPKAGDLVAGTYAAEQYGAFAALGSLTDTTKPTNDRLVGAYQAMQTRIINLGNTVNVVVGLTVLKVGLRVARRVGGKYVRGWL